jgi:hypothetical protein
MDKYWVQHKVYKGTWMIKRGFITLDELGKIFYLFSNSINWEILGQRGMRFQKVSNFIQMINDYYLENKHDLT